MDQQAGLGFLTGGGEMGTRIRAQDWTATPLGPPASWPQSLRSVVGLLLNSKFPMFVAWGEELGFLYNDAYIEVLGAKHPRALGGRFHDIWSEIWSDISPLIDAAMAGQATYRTDLPLVVNRKGFEEQTWFTFSYSPVRDESGAVAGMYCACTETTAQVLAERRQAFRLMLEERLRDLADPRGVTAAASELLGQHLRAGRCGYGEVDETGEFITIERDWTDGAMPSAGGRHHLDQFGPDLIAEVRAGRTARLNDPLADARIGAAAATHLALGGMRGSLTVPLVKDGRLLALLYVHQAAPRHWTDDDETLVREVAERTWAAVERAQAVQALRGLNEALEKLVAERTAERNRLWENANDLLGTAGLDGYLKAVNPAWTRMLGWGEAELLTRPFSGLIDPADHAEVAEIVTRLAAGETVTEFVDRIYRKDGTQRVVMWNAVPEGDVFHIVGRDVTDQRQAEDQLRQAQKMEAVGQLTGGLAHDFNNLLTGITGSLELLQARIKQGRLNEIDRYVTVAQGAAKRAATLTHRLLAFSRRQTLDPKPVNMNRLITGMEELIRRTVGPAVELEVVGAAGLWATLIDPNQLENALLNLCVNARDAMPDGGRLTIETANTWLDGRTGRERDLPPGQYLSLCVTDTGGGMTPDVIKRAFDPFFTTKPIGMGTGLGLSMVYGFARQSGGQVRIYSELSRGTTMCLYLPRHHGDEDSAETTAEPEETLRAGQGKTVLVVDDEAVVRMLVAEVLEDLGFAAIEAADGAAGLRVLQSDAHLDLLITDVGLPGGMNGRQVADAGRAARPGLRVLFITGYAENAAVGNGHLEPGMQVLTKPFAMDALAGRIKDLVADA